MLLSPSSLHWVKSSTVVCSPTSPTTASRTRALAPAPCKQKIFTPTKNITATPCLIPVPGEAAPHQLGEGTAQLGLEPGGQQSLHPLAHLLHLGVVRTCYYFR